MRISTTPTRSSHSQRQLATKAFLNALVASDEPIPYDQLHFVRSSLAALRDLRKELYTSALTSGRHDASSETLRKEVQVSINLHKAVLAPVRLLPYEVLHEIFLLAWENDADLHDEWDPTELFRLPWMLGRVSRRWRAVVLSMPELWSSIRLGPRQLYQAPSGELLDRYRCERKYALDIVQESLYRALESDNAYLLHISFSTSPGKAREVEVKMLEHAVECSERWQKLSLDFKFIDYPKALRQSTQMYQGLLCRLYRRLPNLERLSISFPDDFEPGNAFMFTPRLFDLTISSRFSLMFLLKTFSSGLSELTTLTYGDGPPPSRLLPHLPNLTTLTVVPAAGRTRFAPMTPRFTHHFLRTMTCEAWDLADIELPSLEDLSIHNGNQALHFPKAVDFLLRTTCRLHSLSIYGGIDDNSIPHLITAFQRHVLLRELSLATVIASEVLAEEFRNGLFQFQVQGMEFLPYLERFTFSPTIRDIGDWQVVVEIFGKRPEQTLSYIGVLPAFRPRDTAQKTFGPINAEVRWIQSEHLRYSPTLATM